MIYNPDTIDLEKLKEKGIDPSLFLKMQVKYRESFEFILKQYVFFQQFDEEIERKNVPALSFSSIDFYHQYSTLGSKYLFLRNNFHIERLDDEELQVLRLSLFDDKHLSIAYLQKTFLRVLFEEEEHIFVNTPILANAVLAKSFIIEFSYDLLSCKDVSQIKEIEKMITNIFQRLKNTFSKKTNIPVSFVIYTATPDLFQKK